MNRLTADVSYNSMIKHGEQLCGDNVEVVEQDDGSFIIVLADGLGSGVKASILSTLTAKIISTMMAGSMSLRDCVQAVTATLPVCEERGIAYSTFTIIKIGADMQSEIIQYDNPPVVILRNGKSLNLLTRTETLDGKSIHMSSIQLCEGDAIVTVSDGVIHSGVGKKLSFGWGISSMIEFLEEIIAGCETSKAVTMAVLDRCMELSEGEPGDDTTVCSVKIRKRDPINLLIGPPSNPAGDMDMMECFFSEYGRHIVCGGTTSELAAAYLGKRLEITLEYADPEIPPMARIEGVDIVCEGIITINRVLLYAKDCLGDYKHLQKWRSGMDAASRISRVLFDEATEIYFFVGKAINPAHQNPELPIDFSIKMRLVEELLDVLRKMGKRVKVRYF